MNKNEIDKMLEDMQKNNVDIVKEFPSAEEFKKKFFEKVKEEKGPSRRSAFALRLLFWGAAAACACIVVIAHFGQEVASLSSALSQSMAGAPADADATTSVGYINVAEKTRAAVSDRHGFGKPYSTGSECSVAPVRRPAPSIPSRPTGRRPAPSIPSRPKAKRPAPSTPAVSRSSVRYEKFRRPAPRAAFNTEEYKTTNENPFLMVAGNPLSTFGVDVDTASYAMTKRMVRRNNLPPKHAVRIEEFINAFRYNYPAPSRGEKFAVAFESAQAPWNPKHKLLLIGMQAKELAPEELPPANYVFLVDNSGSMYNEMPLVIEALTGLINKLRPCDRLSLITYSGSVNTLLDGISADDKDKAISMVKNLSASGVTNGGKAIQNAYEIARKHFIRKGNNRIVMMTDGDFNVGVSSEAELVEMVEKERKSLVYLSIFGFGHGNYKDNKLKMLANKGNGNYAYIGSLREARNVAKKCFAGSMFALARDVKLQIEFNPARVKGYRLLGYELRNLAAKDFNDDTKDSGETGVGQQVTALYELVTADSNSTVLGSVDQLKYQQHVNVDSGEILTCKLRYQDPEKFIPSVLKTFSLKEFPKATENLQWAGAVAEFALLLRDSQYKGSASYASVLTNAKKAIGSDEEGTRAEFITMAHAVKDLVEAGRR